MTRARRRRPPPRRPGRAAVDHHADGPAGLDGDALDVDPAWSSRLGRPRAGWSQASAALTRRAPSRLMGMAPIPPAVAGSLKSPSTGARARGSGRGTNVGGRRARRRRSARWGGARRCRARAPRRRGRVDGHEVGEQVVPAPTLDPPSVDVGGHRPERHGVVDGRRAPDQPTPGVRDPLGARLGLVPPEVVRFVGMGEPGHVVRKVVGPGDRTRLEHEHPTLRLAAQLGGQHASGAPGADDHDVPGRGRAVVHVSATVAAKCSASAMAARLVLDRGTVGRWRRRRPAGRRSRARGQRVSRPSRRRTRPSGRCRPRGRRRCGCRRRRRRARRRTAPSRPAPPRAPPPAPTQGDRGRRAPPLPEAGHVVLGRGERPADRRASPAAAPLGRTSPSPIGSCSETLMASDVRPSAWRRAKGVSWRSCSSPVDDVSRPMV